VKTKTTDRMARNVSGSGRRAKSDNGIAPVAADSQAESKKRKDDAFGAEHAKPSDSRSVIRATEGKRWTARQQGRG
jgi:hypothetical protein